MKNNKLHRFYAITDRKKFKKPFFYQIEKILQKTKMIQIREKDLPASELVKICKAVKTKFKDATVIVNDRVDVAVISKIDGVHLPENSFDVKDVKTNFPELIVGKSCHSFECAKKAEKEGADYIIFSPIFEVEGKGKPKGIDSLKKLVESVSIPVYALGGINSSNIDKVFETGVFGVAGIRLFLQ